MPVIIIFKNKPFGLSGSPKFLILNKTEKANENKQQMQITRAMLSNVSQNFLIFINLN